MDVLVIRRGGARGGGGGVDAGGCSLVCDDSGLGSDVARSEASVRDNSSLVVQSCGLVVDDSSAVCCGFVAFECVTDFSGFLLDPLRELLSCVLDLFSDGVSIKGGFVGVLDVGEARGLNGECGVKLGVRLESCGYSASGRLGGDVVGCDSFLVGRGVVVVVVAVVIEPARVGLIADLVLGHFVERLSLLDVAHERLVVAGLVVLVGDGHESGSFGVLLSEEFLVSELVESQVGARSVVELILRNLVQFVALGDLVEQSAASGGDDGQLVSSELLSIGIVVQVVVVVVEVVVHRSVR